MKMEKKKKKGKEEEIYKAQNERTFIKSNGDRHQSYLVNFLI